MRKVLIIGHGVPEPQSTGAGVYMRQLIHLFKQHNCKIHFCATAKRPNSGLLLEESIPYTQIALNSDSFDGFVKKLKPDIVVFDRFMTEEQYSWRVREHCPNAIRVLDTEDLHFLRAHREASMSLEAPLVLTDMAKRELASIYRSDVSLIISEQEVHFLQEIYGVPPSALLHLPFLVKEVPKVGELPGYEDRTDLCFVGTAMHNPNVDAIKKLAQLWPELSTQIPGLKLHIYGSYFKDDILRLHAPKTGFIIDGFVDNLEEKLRSHRLLVAPLRFGAGQKRKVFDAWLAGCPVVTTGVGAEGISTKGRFGGVVAATEMQFTAAVKEIYCSKELWENAKKVALAVLEDSYSWFPKAATFYAAVVERSGSRNIYQQQNPVGQILWHHSLQSSKYLAKWIQEKNKNSQ